MGSSCGPAVAVAAGFAPLAIGTETFGSVVYPASRAAVYGLKGTCGVTSSDGIGKYAVDFDCLGGFAKTVADLGNLMHVVLGREELTLDQRHDGRWNGIGIGLLTDEKWRLPPERVPRVEEILKAEVRIYCASRWYQLTLWPRRAIRAALSAIYGLPAVEYSTSICLYPTKYAARRDGIPS